MYYTNSTKSIYSGKIGERRLEIARTKVDSMQNLVYSKISVTLLFSNSHYFP